MMKIIIDENIAFAKEAFNQFGEVSLMPGKKIINSVLKDADILIVRSVTKVNKDLLQNTNVKFVGTATIGVDHIDVGYLKDNGITFSYAKGCNSYSVAEYIVAALLFLANNFNFKLSDKSLGIVGVGNIGSKVNKFARALGMNVFLNDPPLQREDNINKFVSLEEALNADIVTFHVPLNKDGADKTYHLLDKEKLDCIKDKTILINSSRGAVINNEDLLEVIDKKRLSVILDVWENEPNINMELLRKVLIGTPHIAGYSWEGKVNGTLMIYNALCNYLNAEKIFKVDKNFFMEKEIIVSGDKSLEKYLNELVSQIYNLKNDDNMMRKMFTKPEQERIAYFDELRKKYPLRREFNNFKVKLNERNRNYNNLLRELRFKTVS